MREPRRSASCGSGSTPTTWATVLEEEPDLIVLAARGFALADARERASALRLPVRTIVDSGAHCSRPAPRLADGVRQLAHLFQPDTAPDPDLPHVELALAAARAR